MGRPSHKGLAGQKKRGRSGCGSPSFFVDDANKCDLRQYFNNGYIVYSTIHRKHGRRAKNEQIGYFVSANGMTENERPVREMEKRHYNCDGTKRVDKNTWTPPSNFSTPIIIYIYIHIYFLLNNYCTLWLYVYKALRIRRLGRDKTAVKIGTNIEFFLFVVIPRKMGFWRFFLFCPKFGQFFSQKWLKKEAEANCNHPSSYSKISILDFLVDRIL